MVTQLLIQYIIHNRNKEKIKVNFKNASQLAFDRTNANNTVKE